MGLFDFFRRGLRKTAAAGAISTIHRDRRVIHERLPIAELETIGAQHFDDALKFWFSNRQENLPPDWSCFRPEKHPNLLPHVMLYEKRDGRFFTKLVGDAMQPYLPHKPMGKFLDDITPRDRLDDVTMRLDRALIDGLPNYVEKVRLWQEGAHVFGYNALSMPFVSKDTGLERVFCIVQVRSSSEEPNQD